MFCVYYKIDNKRRMYFGGAGKLEKTISTSMCFGEDFRSKFEEACKSNNTMYIRDVNVSTVAELMYKDQYVKYNSIKW